MEQLREYLLSIVCAAFICSIVASLIPKDSGYSSIIKVICGLFVATTAIVPALSVRFNNVFEYLGDIQTSAEEIVSGGAYAADTKLNEIIKQQSEAYILDKALSLGLSVEVEVKLTNSDPPAPYSIEIQGTISPFQKQRLQQYIQDDLSIPKERQIWN